MYGLSERLPDKCPYCLKKIDLMYWFRLYEDWRRNKSDARIRGTLFWEPFPYPECECENKLSLGMFTTKEDSKPFLCVLPRD